jgi:hypothetical protein
MSEKQETNWTSIIVMVLLVLFAYIIWDAYVHEDSLSKVARGFDSALDRTTDVVIDTTDVIFDTTADVVGEVVTGTGRVIDDVATGTGRVVGGVLTGAGRVLVGAVNAVGDVLIYTGEAIRFDRNGTAVIIDKNGNKTPISKEKARGLMAETESRAQERVRVATEAGDIKSPMEGQMNQDVSNVMASEEGADSQVMDVTNDNNELPPQLPKSNHLNGLGLPSRSPNMMRMAM